MEREDILKLASEKKAHVGEAEKGKINKSCWIANIVAVIIAVVLMVVEGLFGRFSSIYMLGFICSTWASVFFFLQFFVAKRPKGVLVGGVLHGIGAIVWLVFYILTTVGVIW